MAAQVAQVAQVVLAVPAVLAPHLTLVKSGAVAMAAQVVPEVQVA